MKNILKYAFASAILSLGIVSCEDDEQNVTDLVQETVERGAVLRTIDFSDELLLDVDPEQFTITLEEQDVEGGDLLQEVRIYVTYTDNSEIAGDSDDLNTDEVLLDTVPASEFSPGPFGLPRVTLTYSVDELLDAVGGDSTDDIYVGDTFLFREELVLTDGRVFSVNNAGGIITAGFFNSPFQHLQTVTGGIELSFRDEGLNEINIAENQPNDGYSTVLQIQEVTPNLWDQVEVFVSYEDTTIEDDDEDISTEEVSLGVIDRSEFDLDATTFDDDDNVIPLENAIATQVEFDLETILDALDLEIDDLSEDDNVLIRYSVRNSSGREISSLEAPFQIAVPVVDCQVPPIPMDFFVGMYEINQTAGSGPFDGSFGPQYSTQTVDISVDPSNPNIRRFTAFLHPDPGGFSFEVQVQVLFQCGAFLMSNDGGAAAGGTLGCDGGMNSITDGPVESPFIIDSSMQTDEVVTGSVLGFGLNTGGCDVDPYEITLEFTKL